MKKRIVTFLSVLLIVGCENQGKKNSGSIDKANNNIETKDIVTKTGKTFVIIEDHSLGSSLSNIKLEARDFEETNEVFTLGENDPIEDVFLADLDYNGFEELYITTRSAGSGSYSNVFGFASNNDKSVSPIYVPENMNEKNFYAGFRGHNKFSVTEGKFIDTFPVYNEEDTNSSPTGGDRQVQYILIPGEAGWILKPVKIIP